MKLKKEAHIQSLLTLKVKDAVCDLFFPDTIDDIVRFSYDFDDYHVLAGGSNVIAGNVKKPVLYMGNFTISSSTEDVSENAVKAFMPAGISVSSLIDYSVKNGLSGLEFMAGIPGTVGGAVSGNAAPAGSSWEDVAGGIYYIKNGAVSMLIPEFSYRKLDNAPEQPFIIYGVDLILVKDTPENVRKRVLYYLSKRIKIKNASAGSFFKNPENEKAGRLLDQSGMKGFSVNDAALSEDHANIVINKGEATYSDFETLKNEAQKKVSEKFNINLEPEVKFWND
jgi:UDP-N-acetylmuramate dehydrogenase